MDNSIIPTSVRAQGPSSSGTPPAPRLMAGRHQWWPPLHLIQALGLNAWFGAAKYPFLFLTLPFFPPFLPLSFPPPSPLPPEPRWSVITLHSIEEVCYEVSVLARLLFGWWIPLVRGFGIKISYVGLFFSPLSFLVSFQIKHVTSGHFLHCSRAKLRIINSSYGV